MVGMSVVLRCIDDLLGRLLLLYLHWLLLLLLLEGLLLWRLL
jgi:hypothetical protein